MDILLMEDNNLEVVGGAQESTKIIIEGLKKNYSLGVLQPGPLTMKNENALTFYKITKDKRIKHMIKKPLTLAYYVTKVLSIIQKNKPSIIHTQAQLSFFIITFLKKFKLINKNITVIHTERGLYTKYNKILKKIFFAALKETDVLVTTTNFNLKHWKKALKEKKIDVNYRVIENTAGKVFESYDDSFHPSNNKFTIGFAGRYCDWKNWPLAEKIIKETNDEMESNLNVKMAMGCLDDKALKETKNMYSRIEHNIKDRFNGLINIDLNEMEKFYYDIDIFILTSNYNTESFGRTLVEAMSRNTVVLTTNAGGSVEVVGDLSNVCNTSQEFVEKILEFYNNPSFMKDEKRNNMIRVKENYSLENNLQKHLKLYQTILDK